MSVEFKATIMSIPVIAIVLGMFLIFSGTISGTNFSAFFGWLFVLMGIIFEGILLAIIKRIFD